VAFLCLRNRLGRSVVHAVLRDFNLRRAGTLYLWQRNLDTAVKRLCIDRID